MKRETVLWPPSMTQQSYEACKLRRDNRSWLSPVQRSAETGAVCWCRGESEDQAYAPGKPPCRRRSTTPWAWSGSLWGCASSPAREVDGKIGLWIDKSDCVNKDKNKKKTVSIEEQLTNRVYFLINEGRLNALLDNWLLWLLHNKYVSVPAYFYGVSTDHWWEILAQSR